MVVSTSDDGDDSGKNRVITSWIVHKENGRRYYQNKQYDLALQSYRSSLDPNLRQQPSKQDRQMLLSNIVACRLHLGGNAHARAAIDAAKSCIKIDKTWSKGHVRLASAYIALGGHSNDACNSLQTALRYDPGNTVARQMLVRELRRDHANASQASQQQQATTASGTTTSSSYEGNSSAAAGGQQQQQRDPPLNPNYVDSSTTTTNTSTRSNDNNSNNPYYVPPPSTSQRQQQQRQSQRDAGEPTPQQQQSSSRQYHRSNNSTDVDGDDDDIDDVISWTDRVRFYYNLYTTQIMSWYQQQPEYIRSLVKVFIGFLILYIAFGGRFGLEYLWRNPATTDGDDTNAYEEFRRRTTSTYNSNRGGGGGYGYSSGSSSSSRSSSYYDDDYTYNRRYNNNNYGGRGGGSSYYGSFGSVFHLPQLLFFFGAMYIAHRAGMNPLQALFLMNMMGGGGGRRRYHGGGWGNGWGGGGGYGGRRRRFGFGF